MPVVSSGRESSAGWWWGFGLLMALPAVLSAVLGLWAVRAERIERDDLVRRQQTQVARLVDGVIATVMAELETELSQTPLFSFNRQRLLTFNEERVYFGDFGLRPETVTAFSDWPSSVQQTIEQARAAEAQQRLQQATTLYERVSRRQ